MKDENFKKYWKRAKNIPMLSREEERELIAKAQKGDRKAKEKFIKSHLRSVVNIATLYKDRGILFEDLIDEGNLGLLRALKTYDLSRGFRFISYACWWIRHYMLKIIYQQAKAVKIPVQKLANRKTFMEAERELSQKLGRLPTTEEIAETLELTSHEVANAMTIAQTDLSLERKVGKGIFSLADFIGASEEALENSVNKELLIEEIKGKFNQLSNRERRIIELRFGLKGKSSYTLEELGYILSLSRERVRQIEEKALKKLRTLIK